MSTSNGHTTPPRKTTSTAPASGETSRWLPGFFEQSSTANGTQSRPAYRSPQSVSRRQLLNGTELSELNDSRRRLDLGDGEDDDEPILEPPAPLAEESADDLRARVEELQQRRVRVDQLLGQLRSSMTQSLQPPDGSHFGTGLQPTPPPPLCDLKIVYSYVIEVSDSESGLHGKALDLEILVFYHLLKYARGRTGCRGHVHLGLIFFFL